MAVTTERAERSAPPDIRGPTAPLPLATFVVGGLALAIVVLGTVGTELYGNLSSGGLTQPCLAAGLHHYVPPPNPALPGKGIQGAEGICNIVMTARSPTETALLVVAMALGVAAIAVGFGTYRRMETRRRKSHALTGAILGIQAVVLSGVVLWFRSGHGMFTFVKNELNFTLVHGIWVHAFLTGAKNTLLLALGGEAGGIVIGLILAMLALSDKGAVRAPARVYVNFFRGTPLIWQLAFFYFGLSLGLGLNFSSYTVALVVFSLNTGAYASEVFRAGIQSIERGQLEASRGLGLSYLQSMGYVVVPQAVRRVIPPLMNEFVILIKDTALVVILGLTTTQRELFSVAQDGYSATYNATFFVATAIGYLVVTLPLIRLVTAVERRLHSGLVGIAGGFGTG
jgi:His/Glu/Gln/Arg/opine family amino acid ABC transporter permease subunit